MLSSCEDHLNFVWMIFVCHSFMQVRKRPLNKKELAKNEEDIIETYANSLTVHETKLKVSATICSFLLKIK
jgi:hypothetical protein